MMNMKKTEIEDLQLHMKYPSYLNMFKVFCMHILAIKINYR